MTGRRKVEREVLEIYGRPAHAIQYLKAGSRVLPFCFNDEVGFERYRVTIEKIEEDADTLFSRLVELWETCDNFHHWGPLRKAAEQIGRKFTTEPGCRRPR
jgi:hypothetical protein